MVRETRHLWVGNLPDNVREERIREHFQRYLSTCTHFPCFNHILHVCRSTILVISEKVISVICKNWCKNGGGVAASEEEEAESCFFLFPACGILCPFIRHSGPFSFHSLWGGEATRIQPDLAPPTDRRPMRCALCCAVQPPRSFAVKQLDDDFVSFLLLFGMIVTGFTRPCCCCCCC